METLIYYFDTGGKKHLVYVILFIEGETLSQEEVNTLLIGKFGLSAEKREDIKYFEDLLKDFEASDKMQFIAKSDDSRILEFIKSCPPDNIYRFRKIGRRVYIIPF